MHNAHVPRCTRDPSCIMDVLSDAQWRTNTPGLPVLSAQGRTLGNTRRLHVKESGRGGCNTHLLRSLPPPRPSFLASDRRRDLARVRPPPGFVFVRVTCILPRSRATRTDPDRVWGYSKRNGEPMQGWMQHRATPLLFRVGSRRPRGQVPAHQAHLAACHQGEAAIRQDLDGRPPPV